MKKCLLILTMLTAFGLSAQQVVPSIAEASSASNAQSDGSGVFVVPSEITKLDFYTLSQLTDISKITELVIHAGVTNIDENFLRYYCPGLENIIVDEGNPNYKSIDGVLFSADGNGVLLYPSAKSGDYVVPSTVTYFRYHAFLNCRRLTSITIPKLMINQYYDYFNGCESLTAINVDAENERYESIDGVLFYKGGVTLLRCPPKIKGDEYIVPANVMCIIGAFVDCVGLKSIKLPAVMVPFGLPGVAFSGCINLLSMDISEGVEKLGNRLFLNCTSLKEVTIPSTIWGLDYGVFQGCTSLTKIVVKSQRPPTGSLGDATLFEGVPETATVYVPKGCVEAYRNSLEWSRFKNIVEMDATTGVEETMAEVDGPTEVYNMQGVRVADSTDGLPIGTYVVRKGNTVSKIMIR